MLSKKGIDKISLVILLWLLLALFCEQLCTLLLLSAACTVVAVAVIMSMTCPFDDQTARSSSLCRRKKKKDLHRRAPASQPESLVLKRSLAPKMFQLGGTQSLSVIRHWR